MDRLELETLLTLPEHKKVEVVIGRQQVKKVFKCNIPLNYIEEVHEEETIQTLGVNFVVVPSDTNPKVKYEVGQIVRICKDETPAEEWVVQKVDFENYDNLVGQQKQIQELHKTLDAKWVQKTGSAKLDVLYDEIVADAQAAAEAEDLTKQN